MRKVYNKPLISVNEVSGKDNAWYTFYIAERVSTHVEDTLDYNLYDNEYHKYRFDWVNGEKHQYQKEIFISNEYLDKHPIIEINLH